MEKFTRLAPSVDVAPTEISSGTYRFVFSNEKPGRDSFIVLNSAIQYENYRRNPVVLWAHDDSQPPVGKGANIDTTSGADCTIDVTLVPRDILPFAGTVDDLISGGWLRAVSLSWMPIEYKPSRDPGVSVIFTAIDMLEVSVTPLPALPDALLTARSRGVNTRPLGIWAERALEMRGYAAVPRPQLEAIARAASAPRSSLSSTRAARAARAQELIEIGRRQEKVRAIRARIAKSDAGLTEDDVVEPELREAHGHMQRALKHHRALSGHLDDLGEEAGKLREAHRSLTKTLADLGIEDKDVARSVKELDRASRAIRGHHTGAVDAADSAGEYVSKAADCISTAAAASE